MVPRLQQPVALIDEGNTILYISRGVWRNVFQLLFCREGGCRRLSYAGLSIIKTQDFGIHKRYPDVQTKWSELAISEIISKPALYGFHQYIGIPSDCLHHKVSVRLCYSLPLTNITCRCKIQLFPLSINLVTYLHMEFQQFKTCSYHRLFQVLVFQLWIESTSVWIWWNSYAEYHNQMGYLYVTMEVDKIIRWFYSLFDTLPLRW